MMGDFLRLHGSDKAWPHCFDVFYSKLFPDPAAPLSILEIGLDHGGSIRAWADYFPNARIIGIDQEDCTRFASHRIEVHQIEQTDLIGLYRVIGDRKFDWIIDDASHIWNKQIMTMVFLWPALKVGGWYCIEDVAECHHGNFSYREALGALRGEFVSLADADYPDGGQLFYARREK